MEDKDIVRLFVERSEQAIFEIQKKYGVLCRGIIYNVVRRSDDVEECMNDWLMVLWNKIPEENPEDLRAYVCRIARNLACNRIRYMLAEKRGPNNECSYEELEEIVSDVAIESLTDIGELTKLIERFLDKQKKKYRVIFVSRYFMYNSIEEIASKYHYSVSDVKTSLYRLKNKLKEYLIEEGYESELKEFK